MAATKNPLQRFLSRTLGFTKGYNVALFLVLGGLTALFSAYRLPSISLSHFCTPGNSIPGECFTYQFPGRHQTGIVLHLASILPASLLALLQFVPAIRRRAIAVHRYAGYAVWLLSFTGTAGIFMLLDKAAGGNWDTQAVVLSSMFLGATFRAYQTIRQLHIDQHRAWMLRAWVYAWCIVTMRPVFIASAILVSKLGTFYSAQPCDKIEYILATTRLQDPNVTLAGTFPECAAYVSGANPASMAVVNANLRGNIIEKTAALNICFGTSTWICLFLHAALVEVYLHYTSDEDQRLKKVSHQKRLQAGLIKPAEVPAQVAASAAVEGLPEDKKTA
ncbi:uncharacterized protein B0I36DRAFT_351600 [Microdochium trichocladiopsis]|uniref:Uncharacterized protein n=1 Tax=Microdochium trichocladiopsis TaxID=1682393 RepID=A0A9P8Y2V8_9PEZI|nr:uncharacterized protein B0I36DRAFT_351600 [Microdochium trichocladiopsis]KAH7028185.1 hypothetical protein B0I36DRAFT_351600 [Microdochium trichocladiopsis]